MKTKLISKVLGIGVAASTVIALAGALFTASPAAADTTKWTKVNTPSWTDGVILPANDILDYTVTGDDGNTIYVVAEVDRSCVADHNSMLKDDSVISDHFCYGVFKSTDGGVTWKEITDNIIAAKNLPDFNGAGDLNEAHDIFSLNYVAAAPDDPDWVVVTGYANNASVSTAPNKYAPFTVASKNGGDDFTYAGDMKATNGNYATSMDIVYDTEVSPETSDGTHLIAAMGFSYNTAGAGPRVLPAAVDNLGVPTSNNNDYAPGAGTVYVLNAGTWLSGAWEDASFYDGWDGLANGNNDLNIGTTEGIDSVAEIDGAFSTNYADDTTFVVIGVAQTAATRTAYGGSDAYLPFVQTGDFDSKQWGAEASMPDPIQVMNGSDALVAVPGIWLAGIALPADYDGTSSSTRIAFGYVDAVNWTTMKVGGFVFRIDNDSVSKQVNPSGDPVLASIAVNGDADTGKMMIGELAKWTMTGGPFGDYVDADACAGVRVWHTEELDICCPKWELCCKCPSGTYAARVTYTPDGSKEYATTTSSTAKHMFDGINPAAFPGTPGDETAFSVSLDDANSWNQIGLIDTTIDRLSDLVVCPDCSVMYLSTINAGGNQDGKTISFPCDDGSCHLPSWLFGCDSVWRSFDNGDTWERVNEGAWTDDASWDGPALLLRMPCDTTENCCDNTDPSAPGGTIYLGVQYGGENGDTTGYDMWYSRDCGQCWTKTQQTKIKIQDFAVDTDSTVYVIDASGNFSMSSNFGRRWSDSVDTGAGSGHMIADCCGQGSLIVVGPENKSGTDQVAWSDDGGDTWNTTDDIPIAGEVHVACATTCENTIFIAVDPMGDNNSNGLIYKTTTDDGTWTDMSAKPADYTGIAVGRSDGTLYATTDYIEWDDASNPCERNFGDPQSETPVFTSAVARTLDPCTLACCDTQDWSYLVCGLDKVTTDNPTEEEDCAGENFDSQTNALDICGCLTASTNTVLYAIDNSRYNVSDASEGTIWTYEDCASKTGPTLVSPADGTVVDCMNCNGCGAQPFTLKWDRMCNACSYDIEIMDDQGNVVITISDEKLTGTTPTLYLNSNGDEDYTKELVCGSTYQWHVREANTDCECITSQWSATWSFTVAESSLNGVSLISPEMGKNDIGPNNVGFSWTSVPNATSYSFVLSPNANLSGALASQEISTTAFNYAGPLDNEKTYYWQVKAWKDTTLLSTSSIGVFTIAPAPVAPTPPVTVTQTPAPVINIPPAQQITPTWIYAIIGIGAALAVVVIVLIVRTRRP